jgi:HK97 family phage prohead protease
MDQVKSWSTLTIKSVNDEQRIIKGIASTPSTDRSGDIVEPKGATFSLPFPLLSQHDHSSPIGEVTSAVVTDKGIEIEAKIPKDSGLGYVDKAWLQIKSGLVRGLSIGFRGLEVVPTPNKKGLHFKKFEVIELSAVTVPCNAEASIYSIKQMDLTGSTSDDADLLLEKELRHHDVRIKAAAAIAKATISLN